MRTGPFSNDEIKRIREIAASSRSGYGEIRKLAKELQRDYMKVACSVRTYRNMMVAELNALAALPKCAAMVHSGESYAALMSRLLAEPMPGPDHGQPTQAA